MKITELALNWWNSLPTWGKPSKEYYIGAYSSENNVTGELIQKIYDKEILEPKRQKEWQEYQINRRYSPPPNKKNAANEIIKIVEEKKIKKF